MNAELLAPGRREGLQTLALVAPTTGLREQLVTHFERLGYQVWSVDSVQAFYRRWLATTADVVIIDTVATGEEGLQLVNHMRPASAVGCIVVAQSSRDRVAALEAGADLTLSLPPDTHELTAGVRAVLRRYADGSLVRLDTQASSAGSMQEQQAMSWTLDCGGASLIAPGGRSSVSLTTREFDLLVVLMSNPLLSVTKTEILDAWDPQGVNGDYHRVESALSRLRKKVETVCGSKLPVRSNFGRGLSFHAPCRVV